MHEQNTWKEQVYAAIALAAAAAIAQAARAEARPAPEFTDEPAWVEVLSVVKAGSGCPAGYGDAVAYGGSLLIIDYDRMTARYGSGYSLRESRKACQFSIDLEYPSDWTYSVEAVYAETSLRLPAGTTGKAVFSAYFQGGYATARAERPYYGPAASYDAMDLYFDRAVFAPCGERRPLNVKAEVQTSVSRYGGGASRVGLDGPAYLLLRWQRCE